MDPVTTRHSAVVGGETFEYTVTVRTFPAVDASGRRVGTCSTTTYLRDLPAGASPDARPVLFAFNGGPGAASTALHLGGLGPYRIAFPTDLSAGPLGPCPLEANPDSVFDSTDLVFIDAINTGYGAADEGADLSGVYGVEGDAACFAGVITAWLQHEGRFRSPKYVLGESYGTVRAPRVARRLLGQGMSVALSGIALLGQALNLQETVQRPTNAIGSMAALPFMAASAWYHGKSEVSASRAEEVARLAHEFATTTYISALVQGGSLSADERRKVAERLTELTGISTEHFLRSRLRIHTDEFRQLLLEDRQQELGNADARYTLPAPDPRRGEGGTDPASATLYPGFTMAAAQYFRDELGVDGELMYQQLDREASSRWTWQDPMSPHPVVGNGPVPFTIFDDSACLTGYLKANTAAHLFIGTGYYDSLTTVGMVEHLVAQNELPQERLHRFGYESGHMMYTDPGSSVRLNSDLRLFISRSVADPR